MRRSLMLCTVALLLSSGIVAKADTFTFSFAGSGYTATGTLTGTLDTSSPGINNAWDITSASGLINSPSNGGPLTFTLAPGSTANTTGSVASGTVFGTPGAFSSNDVLYLDGTQGNLSGDSASLFDSFGLLLEDSTGNYYEIWSDPTYIGQSGTYITSLLGNYFDPNPYAPIVFSEPAVAVSFAPEPSSLALLGTGLLGTVGFIRRRIKK